MKDCCKDSPCQNSCSETQEMPKRKRGLTSVTLQWIADKFKRAQQIKTELNTGTYKVDSSKVARAMISADPEMK